MYSSNYLLPAAALLAAVLVMLDWGGRVEGVGLAGIDGRRGELAELPPPWNRAPASRLTNRNKGDLGDLDPRGSVRYNIGLDGRILKGIITKQREVPSDDNGTGLFQAKEECCHQDSY